MPGVSPETEEISPMSMAFDAAQEARDLIGMIGRRFPVGTPLKTIQAAAARLSGLPARRVRAFWNREVRRPHEDEMRALRRAAAMRETEEAAAHEFEQFRDRLLGLRAAMDAIDPDFYGPQADAVRAAIGGRQ